MQGLEIDGCIVRRALLPAPRAEADPFERQRSYGSLMGLALVALLLVVHLGPEGMPDRLRRPCDKRVPEARGTREAPAHLGLRAAPCGSWRDPSIFLEFGGGGIAFALVAKGDQETRSEDRARSWQGLAQGEIGMALHALRAGGVAIGAGLHQERLGGDDAVIGGEGYGRCAGLDTLGDDLGVAYVRRAAAGLAGGTASEWRRLAGRPTPEDVAEERGVFLLKPVQHVRERVLEGTGQAVGEPHCGADHAAPRFNELGEGAHRGALGLERRQLVAMGQPQCELACGIGGGVFGPARCAGFALPRQRQRVKRKEDETVIRAQGRDHGPLGACAAEGHGLAVAPRTQRGAPHLNGLRGVSERNALTFCGARSLETNIRLGIGPVDPTKGGKGVM